MSARKVFMTMAQLKDVFQKPFLNRTQIEAGKVNRLAIKQWAIIHPWGEQQECSRDLNLSLMAVNRHVKAIREEWRLTEAGVGA